MPMPLLQRPQMGQVMRSPCNCHRSRETLSRVIFMRYVQCFQGLKHHAGEEQAARCPAEAALIPARLSLLPQSSTCPRFN